MWLIAYAQQKIQLKDATIKIKDGASEEITVKVGDGNLTFTEHRNIEYEPDRGILDEVREGDEQPMDVSLDFVWTYLKSTTSADVSVEEAIKGTGAASGWTSSDGDSNTCRPFAVDIEISNIPTPSGCGTEETILLAEFRWESFEHSLREGRVTCSGRCNTTAPTITQA